MALPPGSQPLRSTWAPPLFPTHEHSSLGAVCCGFCWAHPATVPQVASCSGHLGRPLWVDQTRLLPGCHLGPPCLLAVQHSPAGTRALPEKLGLSVKRGQKHRPVGFSWGHTSRVGAALRSAQHLLDMPSAASPPSSSPGCSSGGIVWLTFSRGCGQSLTGTTVSRVPREVHLVPYQDVKVQCQASGSSQVVPELPVLGLRRADLGSRPPCLVTTGCFRCPPSPGSRPWSCLHSLQGQVPPRGGGGICLLPQEELAGLTAAPWKVSLPVHSTY